MRHLFVLLFCFLTTLAQAQIVDSSKRHIALQGAVNFRDLGGYATTDGRHVKWDRIFRSADISKLTDSDLACLQKEHIGSDVDLRGVQESKQAPDRMNPNTDYILCPAGSDNNLNDWLKGVMAIKTAEQSDSMMRVFYAKTEYFAPRYKPLFEKLLALPDDKALVFHCSAGKDRTGIASALVLYTLGVPKETILADYSATDYYRSAENERMMHTWVVSMHIQEPVARVMLSAKPEYIETAFDAIVKQYGSVENFLKGPLGLDDEKIRLLREKFLE